MSCNCRNSFARFLPGYKEEKPVQERPKVKIIKKRKINQQDNNEPLV